METYPKLRSVTLQTFVGPINSAHYIKHHPEIDRPLPAPALRRTGGRHFKQEAIMVISLTRSASHAANALWRVLSWPARVGAARRTMSELARMSEYELRDIGLTRSDLNDATALPLDADPSGLLVRRRAWRERPAGGRANLAA
jgi:uncharacterized protein YjiS (DUF1127 family)